MNWSLVFLKLQETILTEQSADPTATMFELGWKLREIIGDFVNFYLTETVQHVDSTL